MRLNKDARVVASVLLVIALVFFSAASPNALYKLLFLSSGLAWIILSFCENMMPNETVQTHLSRISGIVLAVLFIWSVISAGSFPAYGKKLQTFFQPGPTGAALDEAAAIYEEASDGFRQAEKEILAVDAQVSQIAKDLMHYSEAAEEQQFFACKYDPAEVEKIVGVIREELEEDKAKESPDFLDIQTNADTVELFYKMRLAVELFHYVDLIRALESIGIDCESMLIDEYELVTWDIEMLFANYSMRQSVLDDAAQGKNYEESQNLYYREFRIKLNEHSDTTDYKSWQKEYEGPVSAEYIADRIDERIAKYFEKLHMNFQPGSN